MSVILKNNLSVQGMTTIEVAKELSVSVRSVQLWLDNGILEGWKTPGGHRRITISSFDQLAEKRNKRSKPLTLQPLKIFIVEDDEAMLMLYRMTIDSWEMPVQITCFNNGWAGIIGISQSKPDLLILYLRMPEMNGFLMLKALIDSNEFVHMSILVITGLDNRAIEEGGGLPKSVQVYEKNPVPFLEIKKQVLRLIEDKKQRNC